MTLLISCGVAPIKSIKGGDISKEALKELVIDWCIGRKRESRYESVMSSQSGKEKESLT